MYEQMQRGAAADRTADDHTISMGEWLKFAREFELCPLLSVEQLKRVSSHSRLNRTTLRGLHDASPV